MIVEVAICTWNRAALLQMTLQRLTEIEIPSDTQFRVIVVDNNSTDQTPETIKQFESKLGLVYVTEREQGHTHARNCAIEHAMGDLLLWIDDDVLVSDDWLSGYVRAASSQAEVSFWGGPIEAKFLSAKPKWISENWDKLQGCFAVRYLGESPIELDGDHLPYGANFAIRTAVQKKFPFQTSLGRTNDAVVGEDELQLLRRVLADGMRGSWIPESGVEHLIDSTRTTTGYVHKYFVGQGQMLVAKQSGWTTDVAKLKQEADHELFWYRVKRWFTKSDVWLSHLIRGSLAQGQHLALTASGENGAGD